MHNEFMQGHQFVQILVSQTVLRMSMLFCLAKEVIFCLMNFDGIRKNTSIPSLFLTRLTGSKEDVSLHKSVV